MPAPDSDPCFYKSLTSHEQCSSMFQIPSEFVKSYGDKLPSKVTFRIGGSEKSWNLGIDKIGENYFFTDGWTEFSQEFDVGSKNYHLIFKFHGLDGAPEDDLNPSCKMKVSSEAQVKVKCESEDGSVNQDDGSSGYTVEKVWRFTIKLKEYHKNQLEIPGDIAIGSGIAMNREIILEDEEGRTWPVCMTGGDCGQFFMTMGWYNFLAGNNLVVGSSILLEFASNSNYVITRVLKDGINEKEKSCSVKREEQNPRKGDGANHGRRWRFTRELKQLNAYRLNIPKKFVRGIGISKDTRMALLDANENKWPVRVTDKNCGEFSMTSGWNSFLRDNKISVGSMLSFEFVSSSDNLIEVRVIEESVKRARGRPRLFSSIGRSDIAFGCTENVQSENEDHISSIPKISKVDRQWKFVKELKQHHSYRIEIPQDFAMGTGIHRKEKVRLIDGKGRKWPVDLKHKKNGRLVMTSGWNEFLVENNVMVGDTITFEFVPNQGTNTVEARVINTGAKGKEPYKSTRKERGRPPSN